LFPAPQEIKFNCSCPDWAAMCKHVAAVLYGVGARLDAQPELLFALRRVDAKDLVTQAGAGLPKAGKKLSAAKVLDDVALADVFGIEMEETVAPAKAATQKVVPRKAVSRKTAPKKVVPKKAASLAATAKPLPAPAKAPSVKKNATVKAAVKTTGKALEKALESTAPRRRRATAVAK
jgi:uncharacterized Zn finger protein